MIPHLPAPISQLYYILPLYLSQYLTNLMHKLCFTISFISCLYMFRAHVLETYKGMKQILCIKLVKY